MDRTKLFRQNWYEMRDECARTGALFSARQFLNRMERILGPKEWKKIEKIVDKTKAGLSHHHNLDYNPISCKMALEDWGSRRYTFMFGKLICQKCGAADGPLFRKVLTEGIGTSIKKLHDYCSDSCSKGSDRANAKREATCLAKYGEVNVAKTLNFRIGMARLHKSLTQEEQSERRMKTEVTKIRRHGSLGEAERKRAEKMMATNQLLYGGNAATCSKKVRAKVVATNLERRGIRNVSQDPEVMEKIVASTGAKRFKRKSITIRGQTLENLQGYEPMALHWLYKVRKVKHRVEKAKVSIPYRHAGKNRCYHPDFAVKNTNVLIEVKSAYTAGMMGKVGVYGSYTTTKAKMLGAASAGYTIYMLIWHPGLQDCFVWKGPLPSKKELKADYKKWISLGTAAL